MVNNKTSNIAEKKRLLHKYNELVESHKDVFNCVIDIDKTSKDFINEKISVDDFKILLNEMEKYDSLKGEYKEKLINRCIELEKILNKDYDDNSDAIISQFRQEKISEKEFKTIIEATEECCRTTLLLEKIKREKGLI